MAQIEAKVYFDGSHYIAIPKSESAQGKKSERFYSMENEDKKAVFENAYKNVKARKRKDKVKEIINEIKSEFESEEKATEFVIENMQRLNRNLIVRRMRLARKINLGNLKKEPMELSGCFVRYYYGLTLCEVKRNREAIEIVDYLIDVISHYKITDPTFLYIRGIPTAQMIYELIKLTFVDDEIQFAKYKNKLISLLDEYTKKYELKE